MFDVNLIANVIIVSACNLGLSWLFLRHQTETLKLILGLGKTRLDRVEAGKPSEFSAFAGRHQ